MGSSTAKERILLLLGAVLAAAGMALFGAWWISGSPADPTQPAPRRDPIVT